MRKRSKKRIPQDVKAWSRVNSNSDELFSVPVKQATRWVAGSRRDWETKILLNALKNESILLTLKSFTQSAASNPTLCEKIKQKLYLTSKFAYFHRQKNYCVLSGRARTFNRTYYLARHNLRKLVGVGVISGLAK